MVKVLMHVVGYSSILPKDWKRMQYSVVKYLRENMGQERCTKKWGYACLVAAKVVEICRRTWMHFNSSIYRNITATRKNTINNRKTTVKCTIMMT